MKLVSLFTFALLPFLNSANASEPSTESLITNCLKLNSTLTDAFKDIAVKTKSGQVNGINKASFHYQNVNKGFKGICSNDQFDIKHNGLQSTVKNQHYVFVWSADINAGSSELSLDNINYSLTSPKDIKNWLQEKI